MYQIEIMMVSGSKYYRLVMSKDEAHFELFRVSQAGTILTYQIKAV